MKPGPKPKLTSRPPKALDAAEKLARSEEWAAKPAAHVAAALETVAPAEVPPAAKKPRTKAKADVKPQADEPPPAKKPWDVDGEGRGGTKLANFNLPVELYRRLKYLGDTTYMSSMTAIVIEALEVKTTQMLKDKGLL